MPPSQARPAAFAIAPAAKRRATRRAPDFFELFRRGPAIVGNLGDPLEHLPDEARDADHEEFVEVAGRDRKEPQPLQQRMVRVRPFLQYTRLNSSQDTSRLMNRSGEARSGDGASSSTIDWTDTGATLFLATRAATTLLLPPLS